MCDICQDGSAPNPAPRYAHEMVGGAIGSAKGVFMRDSNPPTRREQLIKQREDFKARVESLNEAIDILENHPEIEAIERYRQLERTFSF